MPDLIEHLPFYLSIYLEFCLTNPYSTAQVDPKGWIPHYIINKLSGELSKVVLNIRGNMPLAVKTMAEREASP